MKLVPLMILALIFVPGEQNLVAAGRDAWWNLPARRKGPPPQVQLMRQKAEQISRLRLPYLFGGCTPNHGGMDCSGSVQYLLKSVGYQNVPRTSYAQFEWVKKNSRLKKTRTIDGDDLEPGDLIFWGGTYDSGHKVSHVMIYTGRGTDGKLYMFGARSKRIAGVGGAGVDIHVLKEGKHSNLIGFGSPPKAS